MKKLISFDDHIFIAGGSGMVGSSLKKTLKNAGYGNSSHGGKLLTPSRQELNLLNFDEVFNWYETFKPTVVIIAAGKVGGINANANFPADFILENLKIQTKVELRRKGDPHLLLTSPKKAFEELNWVPKNSKIDIIVRDAWKWFQSIN